MFIYSGNTLLIKHVLIYALNRFAQSGNAILIIHVLIYTLNRFPVRKCRFHNSGSNTCIKQVSSVRKCNFDTVSKCRQRTIFPLSENAVLIMNVVICELYDVSTVGRCILMVLVVIRCVHYNISPVSRCSWDSAYCKMYTVQCFLPFLDHGYVK